MQAGTVPSRIVYRYDQPRSLMSTHIAQSERRVRRLDPELAKAVHEQFTAAWERGVKQIVARAAERGDVPHRDDRFFDLFGQLGPSVMLMRYLLAEGPIDPEFVSEVVDGVLLPILRAG